MVTVAKSSTPSTAAAKGRTAAKKARTEKSKSGASAAPSLRFFHSDALREQTDAVLSALETHPTEPHHGQAIADLVNDLIEAGMDYYFLKALQQAQVGFVAEQSARLGLSGAVKLISSVSRKYITRMNPPQLLVVATHIRTLAVA